jgi:hypothetical protein
MIDESANEIVLNTQNSILNNNYCQLSQTQKNISNKIDRNYGLSNSLLNRDIK